VADKLDWGDRLARQRPGVRQPLPLFSRQDWRRKSGGGPPHSKTLRNFSGALANHGCKFYSKRHNLTTEAPRHKESP